MPGIEIKIINNTGKTIVNNYREHDGRVMWYRTNWKATVKPGEEMVVISKWSAHGMPRVPFSRGISFNYTIDSIQYTFQLKTWGEFIVDLDEQKRISDENKSKTVSKTEPKPEPITTKKPEPKKDKQATQVVNTDATPRMFHSPIHVVKKKTFYDGEEINKTTRKGFKTGKWVYLYENNAEKSQEFYSGKEYHWDSAYFYYENTRKLERKMYHIKLSDTAILKQEFNEQGRLYKTYFWNGEERLEPTSQTFYPSGQLRSITYPYPNQRTLDYYRSGSLQKRTIYTPLGKVDTIHYFYESGILQKMEEIDGWERPKKRITYDEDGDQLTWENVYHRNKYSWKYLLKTDSLFVVKRYYNDKHTWTDSGTYINNELWDGIRISTQGGIYSLPKVFTEGRENGFYYQNEWVNRSDSLGKRGKWLTLYRSGSIKEFSTYTNEKCDSTYQYYESGAVQSIVYPYGSYSSERRQTRRFYETGSILFEQGGFEEDTVWVSYYPSGEIDKMKRRNAFEYDFEKGNTCTYVITRPKIREKTKNNDVDYFNSYDPYNRVTGYGPIEDFYKGCTQYKRITSRYYTINGIEGSERRYSSYTIDIGSFSNDALFNGKREYYDSISKLLRTVKVRNGKEI